MERAADSNAIRHGNADSALHDRVAVAGGAGRSAVDGKLTRATRPPGVGA
jgi:hypothetical protein